MSRLFSESELALLRRQFFSDLLGQELTEETADALVSAAAANERAEQALDDARQANEQALAALADAQASLKPPDLSGLASEAYVNSAVSGLASQAYVNSAVSGLASEAYVDGKFTDGLTQDVTIDGTTLTFVDGLLTGVSP